MDILLQFLLRCLLILLALVASSLVAGFIIGHSLLYAINLGDIVRGKTRGLVLIASFYTFMLSLGPALVIIGIAEWRRLRSIPVYGLTGGLTAALLYPKFGYLASTGNASRAAVVLIAAGFVAGLCYGALAGRFAGAW